MRSATPSRVRVYKGADPAKPITRKELVPADGEPACSSCGARVRLVRFIPGQSVRLEKPVAGNHAQGGGKSKYGVTCPGSYIEPKKEVD